jgi:hypothetical protein
MPSSQPDGQHIHAAGQRDDGVVGDSQYHQTQSPKSPEPYPSGDREQQLDMRQHSIVVQVVYRLGCRENKIKSLLLLLHPEMAIVVRAALVVFWKAKGDQGISLNTTPQPS